MKRLSGRFVLRLSSEDHHLLKTESRRRGLSLNDLCLERLTPNASSQPSPVPGLPGLSISELLGVASKINFEVIGILLFGSFARGEGRADSDVDLLLVLPASLPIDRSLYTRWDEAAQGLRGKLANELCVHFVHLPEDFSRVGSLWLECALDGKILFQERDGQFEKALRQIRMLIAQGRWRRQYAYGQPYWVGETQ